MSDKGEAADSSSALCQNSTASTEIATGLILEFVEREGTHEPVIELGIRLHLAGVSLSNIRQHLETLGVKRSRTAIHNWVQKTDLQPTGTKVSNYVAVDETVIQLATSTTGSTPASIHMRTNSCT